MFDHIYKTKKNIPFLASILVIFVMKMISLSRICLLSIIFISAFTIFGNLIVGERIVNPEEIGGFFEGDMITDRNFLRSNKFQIRNAIIGDKYLWPDRTVYYKFAEHFSDHPELSDLIREAIDKIEKLSCVRFLENYDLDKDYILFTNNETGCFAPIGKQRGIQRVNLQIDKGFGGCYRSGTILHELLHTLGFVHQHTVPNRDDFIEIRADNIAPNKLGNFLKYPSNRVSEMDLPYDYDSVMHYFANAFSANGEPTIVPLEPNVTIGQRIGLSRLDIKKLNILYDCEEYKKGLLNY